MERYRRREHIEFIHSYMIPQLPYKVQEILRSCHFVTGYSPKFIGLHNEEFTPDGRRYDTTTHVSYGFAQRKKINGHLNIPTIILLDDDWKDEKIILHEIGHAVHENINFHGPDYINYLNEYAGQNYNESFATAFQSWATSHLDANYDYYHDRNFLKEKDDRIFHFFNDLLLDDKEKNIWQGLICNREE